MPARSSLRKPTIFPQKFKCQICDQTLPITELFPAGMVKAPIVETILKSHPNWKSEGFVCVKDLDAIRTVHIESIIRSEQVEWSDFEEHVLRQMFTSKKTDPSDDIDQHLSIGQKMADKLAQYVGSWQFIITFSIILVIWILFNTVELILHHFDPYPYILLNLVLSCIAALQAPVIMMSQNRQEEKDRLRSKSDYLVNLNSELQIRQLNAKLDLLISHQWQHLLEIQQIQTDMLESIQQSTMRRPRAQTTQK